MSDCLIALGSNIGDRQATLDRAVELLSAVPGVHSIVASRWHVSAPVGGPSGQGEFLNGAARLQTSLRPHELLQLVRGIEHQLGRRREQRWAARTIDIDLLLYDDFVLDSPELTIPHPRMAFRRFVLEPAAEIAADMRHPVFGWTVAKLFEHLTFAPRHLIVFDADAKSRQSELATAAATRTGGKLVRGSLAAEECNAQKADLGDRWLIVDVPLPCGEPAVEIKVVVLKSSRSSAKFGGPIERSLRDQQPCCPWIHLKDVPIDEAIAELLAIMESMR